MANRPYIVVFNGERHIVEAPGAAQAVHHLVGDSISELRPARAAEVSQFVREGGTIKMAGTVLSQAPAPVVAAETNQDVDDAVLAVFEDWAGYDRSADANTKVSADTVAVFAKMHPAGQLDLMTFDVLRERAPEFGCAIVSYAVGIPRLNDEAYRDAIAHSYDSGLAKARAQLEEQPMPFPLVVKAIAHHAGLDAA